MNKKEQTPLSATSEQNLRLILSWQLAKTAETAKELIAREVLPSAQKATLKALAGDMLMASRDYREMTHQTTGKTEATESPVFTQTEFKFN